MIVLSCPIDLVLTLCNGSKLHDIANSTAVTKMEYRYEFETIDELWSVFCKHFGETDNTQWLSKQLTLNKCNCCWQTTLFRCIPWKVGGLTDLDLGLFSGVAIRGIQGFVMHICITRKMKVVFNDPYINGLVQERRNSSAKALELRLSCTNPLIRVTPGQDELLSQPLIVM